MDRVALVSILTKSVIKNIFLLGVTYVVVILVNCVLCFFKHVLKSFMKIEGLICILRPKREEARGAWRMFHNFYTSPNIFICHTRVYPKVSGLSR